MAVTSAMVVAVQVTIIMVTVTTAAVPVTTTAAVPVTTVVSKLFLKYISLRIPFVQKNKIISRITAKYTLFSDTTPPNNNGNPGNNGGKFHSKLEPQTLKFEFLERLLIIIY